MSLVVFTGGARSGKSSAAQSLAAARALGGASVCVAVFGRATVDGEFSARVAEHRRSRPAEWMTIEASDAVEWTDRVPPEALLVVDCLGTLLGLAMEAAFTSSSPEKLARADAAELPGGVADAIERAFDPVIEWLTSRDADTIVVTNEVGDGVVPAYATGRLFRDMLGRANRRLVDRSDLAYLCVAGRLVDLTELAREPSWPID